MKEIDSSITQYNNSILRKGLSAYKGVICIVLGAFAFNASSNHYKNAVKYVLQNDIVLYFLDYDTKLVHPDLEKQVEKAFKLLNLDDENTILMGDSAGGYLCLDLYAKLKKVKALMLFYPVVTNKNFESKEIFKDTPIWNSKLNKKMWKRFLNNQEVVDFLDVDFLNIPKTCVETCEYDCLKDEGLVKERLTILHAD